MATLALMEKEGEGQMFVPPDKVKQFIEAGWMIVQPAGGSQSVMPNVESQEESKPAGDESPVKGGKAKKA